MHPHYLYRDFKGKRERKEQLIYPLLNLEQCVVTLQQAEAINNAILVKSISKDPFSFPYPLSCSLLFVDSILSESGCYIKKKD